MFMGVEFFQDIFFVFSLVMKQIDKLRREEG